jgi:hypothetical protein
MFFPGSPPPEDGVWSPPPAPIKPAPRGARPLRPRGPAPAQATPQAPIRPAPLPAAQPQRVLEVPTSTEKIRVIAVTSMSPDLSQRASQLRNLAAWREAECAVVAFQTAGEIAMFGDVPDVRFVEVPEGRTGRRAFGRPVVPISRMLDWARWSLPSNAVIVLANADNRLVATPQMMQDLAAIIDDGVLLISRFNVDMGAEGKIDRECYGLDGFGFRVDSGDHVPESDLCMGRPGWDWLIPWAFESRGKTMLNTRFPLLYHKSHPLRWSAEDHAKCIEELLWVTGHKGHQDTLMPHSRSVLVAPNPAWGPIETKAPVDL